MKNPNSDCQHKNPIFASNNYCSSSLTTKLQKLQVEEEEEASKNLTVSPVRENAVTGDCTTPTTKEHKIPDPMTCPPAPRKRKALLLDKDNPLNKLTVTNTKLLASPELDTAFRLNFSEK